MRRGARGGGGGSVAGGGGAGAGPPPPHGGWRADEPTGNLDSERSVEIMELLTRLNRERGLTVLMVTHEADMAAYAHTVIRFRDGLVDRTERRG